MNTNTSFDILGTQIVREVEQTEIVGDGTDWLNIIKQAIPAVSETATGAISNAQKKKADAEAAKVNENKAQAAFLADAAYVRACANVTIAESLKESPIAIEAKRALVQAAQGARAKAAEGLTPEAQQIRLKKNEVELNIALGNWSADPSNIERTALYNCWKLVVGAAPMPGIIPPQYPGVSEPSAWTKRYGGVPVWGWVTGGGVVAVGLTGLILALRHRR